MAKASKCTMATSENGIFDLKYLNTVSREQVGVPPARQVYHSYDSGTVSEEGCLGLDGSSVPRFILI